MPTVVFLLGGFLTELCYKSVFVELGESQPNITCVVLNSSASENKQVLGEFE